ncbi:uncharacterized protein LOC113228328 [Hyposmocoma kahamanoa]|uniref:uncharacterized protein LOC113228328 n=1 Tax=Hyposmocoma kahamanoa TaxID=1477025 RepID=UPI000E6D671A|nr:uncharacterized protein LOC113228328 [Hyposmocoma kahamanoa]
MMEVREFQSNSEFPKFLDSNDPLGHFRQRFCIQKSVIYMCGNSLGPASKDAEETLYRAIEKWKEEGVKIWSTDNNKYFFYSRELAQLMAPLINCDPEEIAVTECVTTNIHQVIGTFFKPTKIRYKIIVDDINFPTDRYAIDGQVRLKGLDPVEVVKVVKAKSNYLDEDDVINAMTEDVQMVFLPTVYYRTAQIVNMKKVTEAAKKRGIVVGWDFCHAIGAIEIDLKLLDADFAVWCTYKYLNGGPGSTAALYINKRHFKMLPGLPGWFGNKFETQFLLRQTFEHQEDANGWQIGTPTIFSSAPLEGSLRLFQEAGIQNIRKKSLHLTAYLMYLVDEKLTHYGFTIGNSRNDTKRGGHVCLEHNEGYRISKVLLDRGVIQDFRDPNVIRLTPTALYTSYFEVYRIVEILEDIMKGAAYKEISTKKTIVV